MMYARRWRDFNIYLLLGVFILLGFGLMLVWSTTVGQQAQSYKMFIKHTIFLALGLAGMVGFTVFDYHNFRPLSRPIYVVMLIALGLVSILGRIRDGAQSELFGVQPSEPAKLLLIIALASWWSARRERTDENTWLSLAGSLLLAGAPLLLVLLQPDFGTAMVLGFIWLAMAWASGIRWFHVLALVLTALPLVWFSWTHVLQPYQKGRLVAFTLTQDDVAKLPNTTPSEQRIKENVEKVFYQTDQSVVAIGHGGRFGQGLNHGSQSQLNYLPVQYTDFIFATAGEELGFVGATALLAFECFVLWQAVNVAVRARDLQGRLLASGVVGLMFSHTAENIGMNMRLLPMTGIPLPFISFGGSFTITMLCCIGLLQSVAIRRRSLVF